jgi:DNA modification methylase
MSLPPGTLQKVYREYSRNNVYDYAEHVKLAQELDIKGRLPAGYMVVAPGSWHMEVWDDITRIKTLNTLQSRKKQRHHVCPLPLDIADRIIYGYSNPGDLVLDPFGGIGTVALQAIKAGRKGYSIELNPDYHRDAVGYLEAFENELSMPTLFDFEFMPEPAAVEVS